MLSWTIQRCSPASHFQCTYKEAPCVPRCSLDPWLLSRKPHSSVLLCPQGRSRKVDPSFTVDLYSDLPPTLSTADTILFQRDRFLIPLLLVLWVLASKLPDIAERSKENIFFWFPYHFYEKSVDSTQIFYWFKGAWENSDYFLICLVKLLRAVTSEMAGKGFLGALQIRMYIWIIMNSQLGPLVKRFQ